MPIQRIVYRNGAANAQDWQLTVGGEFTLNAGQSRAGTLTWNGSDFQIRISVTTEELISAADLRYSQLTGLWSLHSQTPREWTFNYVGNDVQVTCLLADRGQSADKSSQSNKTDSQSTSKATFHFEFE